MILDMASLSQSLRRASFMRPLSIRFRFIVTERIGLELASGKTHFEAILSAVLQRCRPIVLSTATTVLGLLPLYLGGGEMREPLALASMGGLLVSTALTLCVVPVFYAALYDVKDAAVS